MSRTYLVNEALDYLNDLPHNRFTRQGDPATILGKMSILVLKIHRISQQLADNQEN